MACHCSVCGRRLHDATENEGKFPVCTNFNGWHTREVDGRPVIEDTCIECAGILRLTVTLRANEIVAANEQRVQKLREELREERAAAERYRKDRAEFEREWNNRQYRKKEEP